MKKRTWLILLLIGTITLETLTGCTNGKDSHNPPAVSEEEEKTISSTSTGNGEETSAVTVASIVERKKKKITDPLKLRVRVTASDQVQLKWNALKKANKYKIIRRDDDKKKVFTFSSKETSFQDTVKKDKHYYYTLQALQKEKGSEAVVIADSYGWAYSGILVPGGYDWSYGTESQKAGETDAACITIHNTYAPSETGIKPDGVEIFRGDTPDSCRYIGEMEYKDTGFSMECDYKDKDVVLGKVYYYKRRSYKETPEGRQYSLFTKTARLRALYQYGNYRMWLVKKETMEKKTVKKRKKKFLKSLVMGIHNSSVGNGDLTLWRTRGGITCEGEDSNDLILRVKKYSFDGISWKDVSGKKKDSVVIHPGQMVYLKMTPKEKIPNSILKSPDCYLWYHMGRDHTNNKYASLQYNFKKKKGDGY